MVFVSWFTQNGRWDAGSTQYSHPDADVGGERCWLAAAVSANLGETSGRGVATSTSGWNESHGFCTGGTIGGFTSAMRQSG
jgi:hypothetical protein